MKINLEHKDVKRNNLTQISSYEIKREIAESLSLSRAKDSGNVAQTPYQLGSNPKSLSFYS
jgi:hypothetical protein